MQYNEPYYSVHPNNERFKQFLAHGPLKDMNSFMRSGVFMNKPNINEPNVFNYIGYQHGNPEFYTNETSLVYKPRKAWDPKGYGFPMFKNPSFHPSYS